MNTLNMKRKVSLVYFFFRDENRNQKKLVIFGDFKWSDHTKKFQCDKNIQLREK
jgi:hypothetical protein